MPPIIIEQAITSSAVDQKQSNTLALIVLNVLYFMMGLITCLNDTLVPFFKTGFTLSYAQSSLVQFYFFLTYGLMSIPAGRVIGKIGYQKGIVLGFFIAAMGALLFLPASIFHVYALFLAALFILAVGIVFLQVAANPYITILGPARTASSRLTLVQGVGALGTTVAPIFGSYVILSRLDVSSNSSEALRYPYIGIATALLVCAIIVFLIKLPVIKTKTLQTGSVNEKNPRGIFGFRNLNFGAIAIFVYVGAEVSIGTFLTNYISDILHIPIREANSYVAFYWGSMVAGRFLGAAVLKKIKPSRVLAACASAAILLIIVSLTTQGQLAIWSMIMIGFFNSVMFAIIFSLSVNGLGNYTTRASGILSTAIVGGAIISFLQGMLVDTFTWSIAFMLPVVCYLYILFYGINGHRSRFNRNALNS